MDTLTLPDEDWTSLGYLARDRKVLMLGYCDGRDVASVAKCARIVVAAGDDENDPAEMRQVHRDAARSACTLARVATRVLFYCHDYLNTVQDFTGHQFGLAIVNPWALGWTSLDSYMPAVRAATDDVALIERETSDSWQAMTRMFPREQYSNTKSGRLIVCRRLGAAPFVEAEG
jgi:hypothetical protein